MSIKRCTIACQNLTLLDVAQECSTLHSAVNGVEAVKLSSMEPHDEIEVRLREVLDLTLRDPWTK